MAVGAFDEDVNMSGIIVDACISSPGHLSNAHLMWTRQCPWSMEYASLRADMGVSLSIQLAIPMAHHVRKVYSTQLPCLIQSRSCD
jgi:hypothetical protein